MPLLLPSAGALPKEELRDELPKRLQGTRTKQEKSAQPRTSNYGLSRSKLHFIVPKPASAPTEKRKAVKNDPRLVAAASELRDRWLEEVNGGRYLPTADAKYDL